MQLKPREDSMTIELASKTDYKSIKRLYIDAFPKHERLPFFMLKRGIKKGKAEIITSKDDGKVTSFAYLILYQNMVYLFYFAVLPTLRNKGIGSLVIKYIKEHYIDKRIFFAIEQPDEQAADNELRIKRKSFYAKNGFHEQVCKLKEGNILFDVMGLGGNVSKQEYMGMFDFWGGKVFNLFMKIVIID